MTNKGLIGTVAPTEFGHRDDVFRLLVESVTEYAIFVLDPEGYVTTWNAGAERIKGYAAHEILGKHFSIFYPEADLAAGVPDRALKTAKETGRWTSEGWRVRKNGSPFWASVVITALRNSEGELIGFAKVTRDLSERREAEQERERLLQREREARETADRSILQLRSIQSLTEAALTHLDLDGLLAELLDELVSILEVDTIAVLLLEAEDQTSDEPRSLVPRAAKGIEDRADHDIRIPVGKGFAGSIAASKKPKRLNQVGRHDVLNPTLRESGVQSMLGVPLIVNNRVIGVLHVGTLTPRDFTQHDTDFLQIVGDRVAIAIEHARLIEAAHEAVQEARVAEHQVKAQDAFLSIAAHELRTPITTLRLATQLLARQIAYSGLDLPQVQAALSAMDQQSAHLGRLISRLLDRVRLQSGQLQLELEHADVVVLLKDVIERIRPTAPRHAITLATSGPACARVDPLRVEQVVTNVLDNAIKFSPDGGPIRISVHLPADTISISIEDRGVGVPPERRSHLFNRFYQAHGDEHGSGMGLGLYISHEIVQRHGGEMRAEFPEAGGTRIIIELPVSGPPPEEMPLTT